MAADPTDEIFDLYQIFVNEIIGEVWLAIILFLIIMLIMSIKAKMPFELTVMFGVLVLAAMYSVTLISILWVFILLFVGTLFYFTISKVMEGQ